MTDRSDEGIDDEAEEPARSRPGDTDADQASQGEPEPDDETGAQSAGEAHRADTSRRRHAGFAAGRAVVVLVVAAVVYEMVVPSTHTDRSRLARLVPTTPGLAAFAKTKPQAGEQNDTQTGLAAVTTAAKKSPGRTGIYSIAWSASQASGSGVIAFLLPNASTAQATLPEIANQQMGATTYATDSLDRKATGSVAGVPGSLTATYEPSAQAPKGTPSLVITEFRYGQVDSVSEAAGTASTASTDATSLARREYALLKRQGGRVMLAVTDYPVAASAGWAAGAVAVAVAFALLPVLRRRRRERRRRAYEAELANRVVVKGQVITKRRL